MIVTCMVGLFIKGAVVPMELTGKSLDRSRVICKYGRICKELHAVDFYEALKDKGLVGTVTAVQWVEMNSCLIKESNG